MSYMNYPVTVYAIRNKVNGKIYVGQTYRPLKYRFEEHLKLLRRGEHTAYGMQEDFDKYGEDSFYMEPLEHIENPVRCVSEREWMKKLKTYDENFGYNSKDTYVKKMRREAGLFVQPSPVKGRPSPTKGIKRGKHTRRSVTN